MTNQLAHDSTKVSVVIPALDEAQTIGPVVTAAKQAASVSEVIVISDGSHDDTAAIARRAGADGVVEHACRMGKGGAVMSGVARARGETIILLDGDLIGLRPTHVERLLEPIRRGSADMAIGVFATDLLQAVLPSLSGQRAIKRSHLLCHPELRDSGFRLEVMLAAIARGERWKVQTVRLEELSHRRKAAKYGLVRGYQAKLRFAEDLVVRHPRVRSRMT